ncbi:sigma-54-dependent Fis family transcriptional regulator [candidate division KSB1 bacterium]|nr:sigma-54-dependent Fis family transcriptional regulator [candidate division KSB1 bacterium]
MPKTKTKILVIDDDPKVSWILSEGLSSNFHFLSARDGIEGIQMVATEKPELILLDIKMPGMSGIEVLERLNKIEDRPEVIMVSGHGETSYVVESVKLGAAEFVNKPFDVQEIEIHINGVLERKKLKSQVSSLRAEIKASTSFGACIGDSEPMLKVKSIIEEVANSDLTVLIRGESGTGKEIAARMLHQSSDRKTKPFVKVNCAAIPRDLLEAELFGYEKGAFTGADSSKVGLMETANKGTFFLDEVGEAPLSIQVKLLRVLQEREITRVGGNKTISIDLRIVAASNKDLAQAVNNKTFREDLYYRLNVIDLLLPPLRERKSDLPMLIQHFLHKYGEQKDRGPFKLSRETEALMFAHDYPGNIRELENIIERAIVLSENQTLEPRHLPLSLLPNNFDATSTRKFSTLTEAKRQAAEQAERQFVQDCLQTTAGHISNAAKMAGIDVGNFHRIMKKHQIEAAHFKKTRN